MVPVLDMADDLDKAYWFPAKRYGWGWGPPCRWQGWIVLLLFLAATAGWTIVVAADPARFASRTPIALGALIALLVMICWWKGEPPRWRWGG